MKTVVGIEICEAGLVANRHLEDEFILDQISNART
jgi:hypothetical protein